MLDSRPLLTLYTYVYEYMYEKGPASKGSERIFMLVREGRKSAECECEIFY